MAQGHADDEDLVIGNAHLLAGLRGVAHQLVSGIVSSPLSRAASMSVWANAPRS